MMYMPTTASSINFKSWNNYSVVNEMNGTAATYIPNMMQTEVQVLYANNTNAIGVGTGGYVNVNIRYQDGSTYTTSGYASSADTTGITYRLGTLQNATGCPTLNIWYGPSSYQAKILTPLELIKQEIRMRLAPRIYTHAKPLGFTKDIREVRARETLHRVLGDDKYKSFLCKGFISVMAKSGLVYQIFPGHDFTKVYNRGIMIDRYCVVLTGNFPPTDSLIMRYLMILNNEAQFKSLANRHGVLKPEVVEVKEQRSLLEMFKEYKRIAA